MNTNNVSSTSLIISDVELHDNCVMKQVTLNSPSSHNALNFDMAKALLSELKQWQYEDSVSVILISGAGDKAFCAGGDVVAMYDDMVKQAKGMPKGVSDFFTLEYELDLFIHQYSKPIIAFGEGYVMGGGLGLFAGASHKIVTPNSRLAMPEISIGLYPDVGASYFLSRLPDGVGLFLGLTGAHCNAYDAMNIGLASALLANGSLPGLINELVAVSKNTPLTADITSSVINGLSLPYKSTECVLEQHAGFFEKIGKTQSLQAASALINSIDATTPWLYKAKQSFLAGSSISAHLVWEQMQRGVTMSLEECFEMELLMSTRCAEVGEFQEGVRARLIDKDHSPKWLYPDIEAVPKSLIERFFTE
ncbi:enoyl-CoA hydratase/isomerase family protein [Alteromonas sp. 5E99-2]|uniref:enoyl-CoA hydratase/isomerase family protein n=1 Tax=Alteromonas sp. 5E99-2 TaxID=2817683 RepID=UPI001A989FAE|nr:enoyl-CoA hydratase/isomerase family protein [Alteromonas sp. 5E99-2]MBO1255532.1 enoyl-CoA hydratase/isomerase family protein [Alteromonas sp. 5E99-2]